VYYMCAVYYTVYYVLCIVCYALYFILTVIILPVIMIMITSTFFYISGPSRAVTVERSSPRDGRRWGGGRRVCPNDCRAAGKVGRQAERFGERAERGRGEHCQGGAAAGGVRQEGHQPGGIRRGQQRCIYTYYYYSNFVPITLLPYYPLPIFQYNHTNINKYNSITNINTSIPH
jgi:hypothetical protein